MRNNQKERAKEEKKIHDYDPDIFKNYASKFADSLSDSITYYRSSGNE